MPSFRMDGVRTDDRQRPLGQTSASKTRDRSRDGQAGGEGQVLQAVSLLPREIETENRMNLQSGAPGAYPSNDARQAAEKSNRSTALISRFLFSWQRIARNASSWSRRNASHSEQLQGYEISASAWEGTCQTCLPLHGTVDLLASRVKSFGAASAAPAFSVAVESESRGRRVRPTCDSITFFLREDVRGCCYLVSTKWHFVFNSGGGRSLERVAHHSCGSREGYRTADRQTEEALWGLAAADS